MNGCAVPPPMDGVAASHRLPAAGIVALTGAGLSTASGIPDFRSPGGVWDRFDPMEFSIERFQADPGAFWDRRARLIAAMDYLEARPNRAHRALAEAARSGRLSSIITQNVDGLHAKAGTPGRRLIELHGNGHRTVCTDCGGEQDVHETLAARQEGQAPRCPCGGLRKPGVVLFGEPVTRMPEAIQEVQRARHLLVAGTSLQVHPAAGLVAVALALEIPVTICNRDPTPFDAAAHVLRGPVEDTVPGLLEDPAGADEG